MWRFVGGDREGSDGGGVPHGYTVLSESEEDPLNVVQVDAVTSEGKQLQEE